MLAQLTPELLNMIVGKIARRADLKRLCETSRWLYHATIPHLYRSLIFYTPESSTAGFAAAMENIPQEYLKYTRELGFRCPIHEREENCCVHHDHTDLENPEELESIPDSNSADEDSIPDRFSDVMSILSLYKFPDDQLRSFKWELGTCVPDHLLWGDRSPLKNQKQIQSVTLITDGHCGSNIYTQYFVDLARLEGLQSLEWRGLQRYDDFESIAKCIAIRGHQIKSLSLDLVSWDNAEKIWVAGLRKRTQQQPIIPGNFFAHTVLDIQPGVPKRSLPSLRFLDLSGVSFHHTGVEMLHAFNVQQLQTLKLRNCPGTFDWLRLIVHSETVMNLKTFELAYNPDHGGLHWDNMEDISETVSSFIRCLRGLENLFAMLPDPVYWDIVTDAISTHGSSLKRVVTHRLEEDLYGSEFKDGEIPFSFQFHRVLEERHLECFGTSMLPLELIRRLRNMSPRPGCKLMHLRTSGMVFTGIIGYTGSSPESSSFGTAVRGRRPLQTSKNENEFADWAFSADGLPNLQILALGDFSFGSRYSEYNVLLCRSGYDYEVLPHADVESCDLVQNNMEMLAACPFDTIHMYL